MAEPQVKVFLWAVPRSISTAFFRAMMNKPETKVLLEPFSRAYYFGSERVSKRYQNEPVQDNCTFKDIKELCEQDYPGYKAVFVKDMAYYLVGRLDTIQYIPEGYVHTFLLRDPKKSVYSLYKMSLNKDLTVTDQNLSVTSLIHHLRALGDNLSIIGWDHFDANEVGFKELYQVYQLVTEELGQEAIVVDADDLLKYPEPTLRNYCKKVGITFDEQMLNWDETPKDLQVFQEWMPWFEGVLTSKTFQPSATKPKSPNVMPNLPKHVQAAIDENMVYYNKMYSKRIKADNLQIH